MQQSALMHHVEMKDAIKGAYLLFHNEGVLLSFSSLVITREKDSSC